MMFGKKHKKVLVLGDGLLAENFLNYCYYGINGDARALSLTRFSRKDFDAGKFYRAEDFFSRAMESGKFDFCLNCIAKTDVDGCEKDPVSSSVVNYAFPALLAKLCAKHKIHLIHISTDYADSELGYLCGKINVDVPVNVYGSHKLLAEKSVEESGGKWTILRTSFVYGRHEKKKSFVHRFVWNVRNNLTKENFEMPMVSNQYILPTNTETLCEVITNVIKYGMTGLFNVSDLSEEEPDRDQNTISVFTFARTILGYLKQKNFFPQDFTLKSIKSEYSPRSGKALRPTQTSIYKRNGDKRYLKLYDYSVVPKDHYLWNVKLRNFLLSDCEDIWFNQNLSARK